MPFNATRVCKGRFEPFDQYNYLCECSFHEGHHSFDDLYTYLHFNEAKMNNLVGPLFRTRVTYCSALPNIREDYIMLFISACLFDCNRAVNLN